MQPYLLLALALPEMSLQWPNYLEKFYPDEDEGDEELDSESLSDVEVFVDGGHSEAGSAADVLRSENLKGGGKINLWKGFVIDDAKTSDTKMRFYCIT